MQPSNVLLQISDVLLNIVAHHRLSVNKTVRIVIDHCEFSIRQHFGPRLLKENPARSCRLVLHYLFWIFRAAEMAASHT